MSAPIQLGVRHHRTGDLAEAEKIYRRILSDHPEDANALHLLGLIAFQRNEPERAEDLIKKAIEINGSVPVFQYNLGNVLKRQNRLQDAADCYTASLSRDPGHLDALNNLGNVYREQGRIKEALEQFSRLLEMKPDCPECHSNLLLTLNYHSVQAPVQILKQHLEWAEKHSGPITESRNHFPNDIDPGRRLRIGYLSPDFRRHSVAYFIEPVLEAHNHSTYDIVCYSNVAQPDTVTERLQQLSDKWRNIWQMPDRSVAERIRRDRIDILVDLAGHMGNNRLPVFGLKPAPVQVTYLGYPNTTGLSAIDYRLTDAWADPEGVTDSHHCEKLVRLPHGFLCFRPSENAPAVCDPPVRKAGRVTFGSFNNIAKVCPETVRIWSAILRSIPDSRLVLKSRALTDRITQGRIKAMFMQKGVPPDRIETIGYISSHENHLALYGRIDIGLDPIGYHGTTTTCEALWMGVPVITLAGKTHASRVGVSLLSGIGMTDFIARTPSQYRKIAIRLANDPKRLHALRTGLRSRVSHAGLTDADTFTASLETAYRNMWRNWCIRSETDGQSSRSPYDSPSTALSLMSDTAFQKKRNHPPTDAFQSAKTPGRGVSHLIDQVYRKRLKGEVLSAGDLMLMLADTILDQSFFKSTHWRFRYGGIRYDPGKVDPSNPGKILVLQWPGALGDTAMAAHFYATLRDKYPRADVALLGNRLTRSLYEQSGLIDRFLENPLDPYLDRVLSGEKITVQEVLEQITLLVKQIASQAFDLLVNLQILPMTAVIAKLSYAKETLGMTLTDDGMPVIYGNQWYPYLFGISANLMRTYNRLHRCTVFRRLVDATQETRLLPAGFISQKSIQRVQRFLDDNNVKDRDLLIGISPLASSPLKIWKKYDGLLNALWQSYGAKMILFGSDSEGEAISKIIEKSGVGAIRATRFDLNELMAAVSGCDLVITNDTGPMHIASLLNKKIVALFGPTISREVGPWSEAYVTLQSTICSECFQPECHSQNICMGHIAIEDVMTAVDFLLKGEKEPQKKLSNCVTCRSPGDGKRFSNALDRAISKKYQRFFEDYGSRSKKPGILENAPERIRTFCESFKTRVLEAIAQLDGDCVPDRLTGMDKHINNQCGFLKTILVFNDMKYLDKRRPIDTDPQSYRRYYQGVLEDTERFLQS